MAIAVLGMLIGVAVVVGPAHRGGVGRGLDATATTTGPPTQPKLVFAHYFPPYPISIDNLDPNADYYATQYLNPDGEKGSHAPYGGFLRDRPLPRSHNPDPNWRDADLATEIKQASSVGIDGFSVDILASASSKNWIASIPSALLRQAEKASPPFKIMLMPDMNGELGTMPPQQVASEIALLAASPAAFRLADGRLVVAPFKAENQPVSWWRDFITAMKAQHGIDVALVPVFVDDIAANIRAFSPITYGMSEWGGRNPGYNNVDQPPGGSALVDALGQLWMQPVSMQDYRPRDQIFDEADNTVNLRNTWRIAIDNNARWVQLTTWNDYSENTGFAPSVRHGTALLDICAYYIAYFKTGTPPPITEDRVFLSHRTQLIGTTPSRQSDLASLRQGSTPGRDAAEALNFLTTPATVTVRVGSARTVCDVPAGISSCTAPIGQPGPEGLTVSAEVSRDGRTSLTVNSPYKIVANPVVQDLSYTVTEGRAS
jgi:Glycosyl hydrolase family 71